MPNGSRIFRPHTIQGKVVIHKKSGTGMGSVLLNKGGPGSGSSYTSMNDYLHTTEGKGLGSKLPSKNTMGLGLGGMIEHRLQSLQLKPELKQYKKKADNISFSL